MFKSITKIALLSGVAIVGTSSIMGTASAEIFPLNREISLTCGARNYIEISSDSPISFINPDQEAFLEDSGLSILNGVRNIIISGVLNQNWMRNIPIHFLHDSGEITSFSFIVKNPIQKTEFGTKSVPTINLTVNSHDEVNINNEIFSRIGNIFAYEYDYEPGFFTQTNEITLSNRNAAPFAESGRIIATGVALEGEGRQFSFKAADEAKSADLVFAYTVRNRLESTIDSECNTWTLSDSGIVNIKVIGTDEPIEPELPTNPGSGSGKFVFRYPMKTVN
ncbi:hypothetical protein [Brucella gallinifaecis]|uniref:hypothetical protein n=1 Tax=Brucella gallinifaecis TaxID=215590 RepID=UPI00236268FF|nr:hypothetical protein [Brucella gallinifaecis]